MPEKRYCIICGKEIQSDDPDGVLCPEHGGPSQTETPVRQPQETTWEAEEKIVQPLRDVADVWQPGQTLLDTYEVVGKLGEGGMGLVYQVHHKSWNMDLAVKQPKASLFATQKGKEGFIREAETWVDLGLHPHITSCYYVRTIDDIPHIFVEFMEGGSLEHWIQRKEHDLYAGGPERSLERILDIAIQFAWGLAYSHEQGLVHQDVKPLNVLMTPEGVVKVTDFGLAKARAKAGETTGGKDERALVSGSLHTVAYRSPEQANGELLSHKTDIWSWAVSVLEMFEGGVFWYDGQSASTSLESYLQRGGIEDIPLMPKELAEFLQGCFQPKPEDRPVDMLQIADRLIGIYQQETDQAYFREIPKAIELRADSLNNKALTMLDLGKESEGESFLNAALEIDLIHPEATYNQALLQWKRGEIDDLEVVSRLEKVLGALPDRWPTAYLLGMVHMKRGDFSKSLDVLEGIEQHPEVQKIVSQAKRSNHRSGLIRTFEGHQSWVNCVAFSPDGRKAISSSRDKSLRLWDIESGECLRSYSSIGYREIIKVVFSSDGSHAISGDNYGGLVWWDLKSGNYSQSYEGYTKKIQSVDFSRDGNIALVNNGDIFYLRNTKTGGIISGFNRSHYTYNSRWGRWGLKSGCISQDRRYALLGSRDNTFHLWDINAETFVNTYKGHSDWVSSVAISPDGRWALSGSGDSTLKLWDLKTSDCLRTYKGHTYGVECVVFSTDGRFALSGGMEFDKTMRLWEISTGICLRTFTGHNSCVNNVCFSPDGKQAMSGADKTPRLWSLDKIGKFTAPYSLTIPFSGGKATEINQDFSNKIDQARINLQKKEYSRALDLAREIRSLPGYERENSVMDIWFELYSHCRLKQFKGGWQAKILKGHEDVIRSVVFHPDGRHVLSGSKDKSLRLWNISTGDCEKSYQGHEGCINSIAISQDGHYAISGSSDSTVRLWNLKTGACMRIFDFHDSIVESVAINPSGKYLLTSSLDRFCLTNMARRTYPLELEGHNRFVPAAVFSPDGRKALSGSVDGTMRLWDLRNGECLRVFVTKTGKVPSVALSPDGNLALSCSKLSVMLWDVKTERCIRTFEGHTGLVNAVDFSPNGKYAISGQGTKFEHGNNIKLWELETGKCLQTFEGHEGKINSLDFSPNGEFIASGSDDMTIRLWALDWDLEDYQLKDWDEDARPYLKIFLYRQLANLNDNSSHQSNLSWTDQQLKDFMKELGQRGYGWLCEEGVRKKLAEMVNTRDSNSANLDGAYTEYMKQGRQLLTKGQIAQALACLESAWELPGFEREDENVALCSRVGTYTRITGLREGWLNRTCKGHKDHVSSVVFSPNGRQAISGSWDRTLKLWNMHTGTCLRTFEGHKYRVNSVALSPDGGWALSGSRDSTLKLWDLHSGDCLRTFEGHSEEVKSVAISPDMRWALSGSGDSTLKLWDLHNGDCLRTFEGHMSTVYSVAFSPDGRQALSGGWAIKLWDLNNSTCLRTLEGHSMSVGSVAFSPDGYWALSGGGDKTLKLWNLAKGEWHETLYGHKDFVKSVAFSPDGHGILSGSENNKIMLWNLAWEYKFPGWADWDEGARPYLEIFLTLHTPFAGHLPQDREPTEEEIELALTRSGKPTWAEADFQGLLKELGHRGYGWLREEGVRRKLEELAATRG